MSIIKEENCSLYAIWNYKPQRRYCITQEIACLQCCLTLVIFLIFFYFSLCGRKKEKRSSFYVEEGMCRDIYELMIPCCLTSWEEPVQAESCCAGLSLICSHQFSYTKHANTVVTRISVCAVSWPRLLGLGLPILLVEYNIRVPYVSIYVDLCL